MLQDEHRAFSIWLATRVDSGLLVRQNAPMPDEKPTRSQRRINTLALVVIDQLTQLDPPADSPEGRFLMALGTALEAYEKELYAFGEPTPEELFTFRRDEGG